VRSFRLGQLELQQGSVNPRLLDERGCSIDEGRILQLHRACAQKSKAGRDDGWAITHVHGYTQRYRRGYDTVCGSRPARHQRDAMPPIPAASAPANGSNARRAAKTT